MHHSLKWQNFVKWEDDLKCDRDFMIKAAVWKHIATVNYDGFAETWQLKHECSKRFTCKHSLRSHVNLVKNKFKFSARLKKREPHAAAFHTTWLICSVGPKGAIARPKLMWLSPYLKLYKVLQNWMVIDQEVTAAKWLTCLPCEAQ